MDGMPHRDPLADAMFAAWANVPLDKVPPEMKMFHCPATMVAWGRVADAARKHLAAIDTDALQGLVDAATKARDYFQGRMGTPFAISAELNSALVRVQGETE
jgi:hypothetical protein